MVRVEMAIINRLTFIDEFVVMARNKTSSQGGFRDVTGNLRSSISYVILNYERVINETFEGRMKEKSS